MTRNPYAQMGNFGDAGQPGGYGGPGDLDGGRPPRVSALAVTSLVVSIVSLIVCCIPGPGVLGMFLAVGAMISISAAKGRRTGTGLAIAGLVIGLLSTVISVAIWMIMAAGLSSLAEHRTTLTAIWQRDVVATSTAFEPAAAAQITPEGIDLFVQEVESEMGAYKGVPQGILAFFNAYQKIQFGAPAFQVLGQQGYQGQAIPVPAEFDNGYATVLLEIAPGSGAGPGGPQSLRNLGVALPSGRIVWLIGAPTLPAAPGGTPGLPAPAPPADGEPADEPGPDAAPEPAPEPTAEPQPAPADPASAPEEPVGGG